MSLDLNKILKNDKKFIEEAHLRSLPSFIIVGAQKSGTSSLFNYLIQHPQIISGRYKEIHYFDILHLLGDSFYKGHFPYIDTLKKHNAITGEASPYYLVHPCSAERIAQLIPHCKIIIMLRNPTHRAISHYHMEVNNKNESRPIKKALDEEDKTINNEYKNLIKTPNYHSPIFQTFSYKKRGLYAEQIQRFQHYFKPEQLHILKSESFFKNPKKETQNIYKFLEINTTFSPTIQTINKTKKKTNHRTQHH